ncbi:TadE/TadG family type IV pilus assembly protein [Alsobacter sp. KACC 23698]|uniref:TadE/TadG family type IV pilus assembly protein n=1 Tax=Alsobacter sp. KACC 23698 TaxID=3149229 RepID=A0AAU7JGX6_9HYPH
MTTFSAAARAFAARRFRPVADLVRDPRGVAAIEFALILPVMLSLYIGSVEVSMGLSADRKVVLLTRTLADLVSQNDITEINQLKTIMNAGKVVLSPLKASDARMRITSIAISSTSGKEATACWSEVGQSSPSGWTAYSRGRTFNTAEVPAALRNDNGTSLVMAEVQYTYKPVMGYVITGTLNLQERIFMRPRISTYVGRSETSIPNAGKPASGQTYCS